MAVDRLPLSDRRKLRTLQKIATGHGMFDGVTIRKSGGKFAVDPGLGIVVSGGVAILLDPTEPGLVLSVAGLKVLLATAGGLELVSGLKVKGLPVVAADPGSPADGDVWYQSTLKVPRVREAGLTRALGGLASSNTADSSAIASSAAETNFSINSVLPVNFFTAGKTARVLVSGRYSDTGTPTLQLKLKAGSVTLFDLGAVTLGSGVSNKQFAAEFLLVCRTTGGTGTIQTNLRLARLDVAPVAGPATVATVDTTAAQTIQLSAQWSASSASNTTVQELLAVEVLN